MKPRDASTSRRLSLDWRGVGGLHAGAALLLCAAFVAAASFAGWRERDRFGERAALVAANIAGLLDANLSDSFDKIDLSLQAVASYHKDQAARGGVDAARLTALLERLQAAQPELDQLRVHDAQGFLRFGRGVSPDNPIGFADRDYFQRLRDDPSAGLVISKPMLGRISRKWGIAFSRRLERPDGSFAGMVSAIWTTDSFRKALSTVDLGPNGQVTIRTQDLGLLVRVPTRAGDEARIGSMPASRDLAEALRERPEGGSVEAVVASDGHARNTAYRRIAGYPYFVIVGVSQEDYLGDWRRNMAKLAVFTAFFAAIIGLAAWRLHRSSRRLEDSEALWKFAIEGAEQGVWDWRLPEGRVAFSPRYASILGYGPGELGDDAQWAFDQVHPEDLAAMREAVDRHCRGETPHYRAEFRMRTRSGDYVWIESSGMVVAWTADARPARMIGTHSDINARKTAEKQVVLLNRQLEKRALDAEAHTRAKDAFLRNMSHEFRTPLNQVMGGIELLLPDEPSPERREWLRRIRGASRDLLRLVEETLDAARLESGDVALESVPFSPMAAVEEVRLMLSHRALAKGLSLSVLANPDLPERVLGDPTRVSQALLNYLDNAIKFTERGSVTLGAREIVRDGEGVVLRFEVRDTGIGIAPEAHESIFEAFTQVDSSLSRPFGGAGIGLANTRSLARLMGGEAGVESVPGQGSLFWFTGRFACPPAPDARSGVADVDAIRADLERLEEYLAKDDIRAAVVLAAAAPRLQAACGNAFAPLKLAVEQFDFERALAMVRTLRKGSQAAAGPADPSAR